MILRLCPLLVAGFVLGLGALSLSVAHAEGRKNDNASEPQLTVALLLSPSEQVPLPAQLDLFRRLASRELNRLELAARLRHVEGSHVAYLELYTNPFPERPGRANAREFDDEALVAEAASLLQTWFDALEAMEQAARRFAEGQQSLKPVIVEKLFDGTAVAEALAAAAQQPDDEEAADEPDADNLDAE